MLFYSLNVNISQYFIGCFAIYQERPKDERGRFQKQFPSVGIYYYTFTVVPIKNLNDRCRQ